MALFSFRLLPIEDLVEWGQSTEERSLNSRALGWAHIWMNVGKQTLLEYSDEAVANTNVDRYVDYAMETFHGDLMERTQSILTPLPSSLASYMHAPRFQRWEEAWHKWLPPLGETSPAEEALLDLSIWPWRRKLDLGYLNGSGGVGQPEVYVWTTGKNAFVRWQTDTQRIEGVRAWSATSGELVLGRDELIHEIQEFHRRYVDAIAVRAREVRAGALGDIAVDVDMLDRIEQELRQHCFSGCLEPETTTAQWAEMEEAMKIIERASLH